MLILKLALAAAALQGCQAKDERRVRQGVIGYGITMYDPPCAYACIDTFKGYPLLCKDGDTVEEMSSATPECLAQNDPFLQSVALCFHDLCQGIANSTLQKVWETDLVGRLQNQPRPMSSYQGALADVVASPPRSVANSTAVLKEASLVDHETWQGNFNGNHGFEVMEITSQTYS